MDKQKHIYQLQKQLSTANDKKYLDLVADLYIGNNISTEVFLEYLTKNLSYPEILENIESNNVQSGGGYASYTEMPLLSVVIPTHGESLCIKKAIDSILCQTYKNIEIIILDDYGNNQKKDVILNNYKTLINIDQIKYYQVKYGKKTGPQKRRYGFYKTHGEYIIFLDHDDFYLDSLFFERAVNFFEKRGANGKKQKEVFSCYGSNALIYQEVSDSYEIKKLNVSGSYTGEEYLYGLQTKYDKPLSLFSSVFVKEKINNYQASILLEDSCIYMIACLNGNVYISDNIIGAYRIWNNNYTKSLHFELILPVIEAKMKIAEKAKNIYFGKDWDKWSLKQAELSFDYSYKNSTYMTYKDLLYMELWGFYKFKNRFMDMGKYYLAKKITENINYPFSDITILQKKLNRAKSYYEILNLWLINKNMGKHVSDYFIKHGYKRISIYGYGEIGKMFFEELSQNKDIDIVSIIDNMFTYRDLEINEKYYRLNNELPETDIIVITPVFAFKNIAKDLKKHGINNYISIEEIFIKD